MTEISQELVNIILVQYLFSKRRMVT